MDWQALSLTLQLATGTTALLLVLGLPLAAWLAGTASRIKFIVEAVVALPLVLPASVLGFYILSATSRQAFFGKSYAAVTGSALPFTFPGILLASVIYNLPFAVRPFTAALATVDRNLVEAAWCLGVSRWATFFRVSLPLAWKGILAGLVLTFAHTVGEFGIVLMVGGNIPGVTRTLSVAIYDDVQALDYASAGATSLVLLLFSFVALALLQLLHQRGGPE